MAGYHFETDPDSPFYVNPFVRDIYPNLEFVWACYKGKKAWFNDALYQPSDYSRLNLLRRMLPINQSELEDGKSDNFPKDCRFNPYFQRLSRSRWFNFFHDAVNGLAGMMGRFAVKENTLGWLSDRERKSVFNDVDLRGHSLFSFKTKADQLVLRDGFCAVKVDSMPAQMGIDRPYLSLIERKDIINYLIDCEDLAAPLKMFAFKRIVCREKGAFGQGYVEQAVVYRLGRVDVYERNIEAQGIDTVPGLLPPAKKNNPYKPVKSIQYDFPTIPIDIYPSLGLSHELFAREPELLDIAEDNRIHYQLWSEYRESLFFKHSPIIVRKGYIERSADPNTLAPILVSAGSVQDIQQNDDMFMLEPSGESAGAYKAAITDIHQSILSRTLDYLGESSSYEMTATEAAFRSRQAQSRLETVTTNIESSWQNIFDLWARWQPRVAIPEDQGIAVNRSILRRFDSETLRQFKEMVAENLIDVRSFWEIVTASMELPDNVSVDTILERLGELPLELET